MNFPLFIARRYLFSKKSTHAINVISLISVIGVAVATVALVIVLSAFNGFHDLVATLFTSFDPQIEIAPADDPLLTRIRQLPYVDVATECVEDNALAVYQDKQAMVTIKGVDDNFRDLTRITDILYGDGEFCLHAANLNYGIVGVQLAQQLTLGTRWTEALRIFCASMPPSERVSSTWPTLRRVLSSTRSTLPAYSSWSSSPSTTPATSSCPSPGPAISSGSRA